MPTDSIHVGDITIAVTRKDIKHVHLAVHPPHGRVTLTAPTRTRLEVARAYAVTKLSWIRRQQEQFRTQVREEPRAFTGRETHYLWGRRYLMSVVVRDEKPSVVVDHRRIRLFIRPGTSTEKRASIVHDWYKALLHEAVPPIIREWERRLKVNVAGYYLRRMKTKWGSCNHRSRHIRLNTELVKKPRDLLEYVVVHEMLHLIERRHSERFYALMNKHYPSWREARAELNALPLTSEEWSAQ